MNHAIFKVMDEHPPLTHEELLKCSTEKIILHNLRFAYTLAKKAAEKYPGLSEDEMIEAMLIGATEAANRWDPSKSSITTYMSQWVPLYVKGQSNENKHAVGRNTMYIWKSYKISEFVESFKNEFGSAPTIKEIADGTGFSETTVYNIHNLGIKSVASLSGSQSDSDEGDRDLNDVLANMHAPTPLDDLCESDMSTILERLIDGLDPLEREVVDRRWFQNHKYKEIVDALELPYPKVKSLEQNALSKLKRELELIETA